jgi:hypothetical protein
MSEPLVAIRVDLLKKKIRHLMISEPGMYDDHAHGMNDMGRQLIQYIDDHECPSTGVDTMTCMCDKCSAYD